MANEKIDFVILWVDGNDPEWQAEKRKYKTDIQEDDRVERYRDWENLKYWFRGVEKYAPWVNKIHFVTWGHVPKWLNLKHEKLNVVNHKDFIPIKYLPTFNCNPIELNIHRIRGLSDEFVYFNDDMFIIDRVSPSDFFVKGMPCDTAAMNIHCINASINHYAPFQSVGMINKYFDKKEVMKKHWKLWLNPKNGKEFWRTVYLLPCPRFPGMFQTHLPSSFLKSTYEEIWNLENDLLSETCTHKFRNKLDYTQWVFKEWQLASGKFSPRTSRIGKNFIFNHNDGEKGKNVFDYIKRQSGKLICINDGDMTEEEFCYYKRKVIESFEEILPEKSSFECE